MKEVKIKYKDLSSKQKTAISTLKEWIHTMYTNDVDINIHLNDVDKENFKIWSYLIKIEEGDHLISATELDLLRDLWDAYIEYITFKK